MPAASDVEITPAELKERFDRGDAPVVIDVRDHDEWDAAHIPQARHIPITQLPVRWRELNPDDEIVLYCNTGTRSRRALYFLRLKGFARVRHLTDGLAAWAEQFDIAAL